MVDLNRATLIGNVVADIIRRATTSGQSVANFRMATNRKWKDQNTGENREEAQFHNVVAWGKLADICAQYVKKGMRLYVEGRITNRSWDDQQTGQKKYMTEIVMENMIMLSAKNFSADGGASSYGGTGGTSYSNRANTDKTNTKQAGNNEINLPPAEQLPTIDIGEEEVKIEDIPF